MVGDGDDDGGDGTAAVSVAATDEAVSYTHLTLPTSAIV